MRIGLSELLIIGVIIIALLKPEKLNEYAKTAGSVFRKVLNETKDVSKSVNDVKATFEETIEPVTSLQSEIKEEINETLKKGKES